jgi:hypothetical protein
MTFRKESHMTPLLIGKLNIAAGWATMVLGLVSGSIIGLWSFAGPFPSPPGHRDYTDLSRRMVRLAHIAFVALPIINILYGHAIDLVPLSESLKILGSRSMLVCMIGVPVLLIAASIYLPLKYLEAIPVSAGILGLAIMAYGQYLLF